MADLNLAEGHLDVVWHWFASIARPMPEAEPIATLGPFGECWSNAWLQLPKMGRRVRYVEGLVVVPGEGRRVIDERTGQHVKLGVTYPHAWLVDLRSGRTYECTAGYDGAERVGLPLASHVVQAAFAPLIAVERTLEREVPRLASFLELAYVSGRVDLIERALNEGGR